MIGSIRSESAGVITRLTIFIVFTLAFDVGMTSVIFHVAILFPWQPHLGVLNMLP